MISFFKNLFREKGVKFKKPIVRLNSKGKVTCLTWFPQSSNKAVDRQMLFVLKININKYNYPDYNPVIHGLNWGVSGCKL